MKNPLILIISMLLTGPALASYVRTTSFSGPNGTYYEREIYATPEYSQWGNTTIFTSNIDPDREYIIGRGHYPPCRSFINNRLVNGETVGGYCYIIWNDQVVANNSFQILNPYGYWQWVNTTQYHHNRNFHYKTSRHDKSGFSIRFSIGR